MEKTSKKTNQAKAPECAKFVEAMRKAFGEENVIVLYVRENGFEMDRRKELEAA